ncbi:MAG: lytic transglycosylase domain-containing protein, partial [Alphaproteobacteria bacterium]
IAQSWRAVAQGYFRAGKDTEALKMAQQVLAHTGEAPLAYWWGGLAAWRLGHIEDSQRLFTLLAQSDRASEWAVASGAFWASRAYLVGGRPERVNDMLAIGSLHTMTFYGQLSRAALGLESPLDWTQPAIARTDLDRIAATGYGGRALALLQVGRDFEAEPELRNLVSADPSTGPAVLSLSVRARLPALSLRLAGYGATPDLAVAAWPMPDWEPEEGFAVDRALVYAFIRQESAFDAKAKSHVGARGLMQLMPRTASFIAGERNLHGSGKHRLFDPEFNMELGQRYIAHLFATDGIGTDLFRLAAAYNAGPGNLRRWESAIDYRDDPLLFIESLPSRETRLFIERILTSFWIYRDRLGQPAPSLEDVVSGTWPGYIAQDDAVRDDRSHAGH